MIAWIGQCSFYPNPSGLSLPTRRVEIEAGRSCRCVGSNRASVSKIMLLSVALVFVIDLCVQNSSYMDDAVIRNSKVTDCLGNSEYRFRTTMITYKRSIKEYMVNSIRNFLI